MRSKIEDEDDSGDSVEEDDESPSDEEWCTVHRQSKYEHKKGMSPFVLKDKEAIVEEAALSGHTLKGTARAHNIQPF